MENWHCPVGGPEHVVEDLWMETEKNQLAIKCLTCGKTYFLPDEVKTYLPRRTAQMKEFLAEQKKKR